MTHPAVGPAPGSADVTHVWQQGDPEPPVGTTVVRADGVRTTRRQLGWWPGPYNWLGILSLGPATDDTPVAQVTYEVVDPADGQAVDAWTAAAR